jgi:hypothetical protein
MRHDGLRDRGLIADVGVELLRAVFLWGDLFSARLRWIDHERVHAEPLCWQLHELLLLEIQSQAFL